MAVGFSGLTHTVQPVVQNTGTDAAPVYTLNASIVAGTSVVSGILDPAGGINRQYNPVSVGFTPTTGDTAAHWLPLVSSISLVGNVLDNYWASIPGQSAATVGKPGQVQLVLTAAAADTVRASSVMNFRLSPNAFVIIATSTF